MNCYQKQNIENAIPSRKEGYYEEVIKRNSSTKADLICLEEDDIKYLRENFTKEENTRLPSMMQMAKNAATSAMQEAKAVINQEPPVSDEEEANRLSICAGCEFYTPNIPEMSEAEQKQNRCIKCGCFMNFKSKLRSAHCPVGKW